jgi:hypothetical protein
MHRKSIIVAAGLFLVACSSKSKDSGAPAPSASAAVSADPNTVVVNQTGLFLGGARLGDAPKDASISIAPLFDKLKTTAGAKPPALTLEIGPETTCRAAMSVYATAASAGYTNLVFKQGTKSIALTANVAKPPTPMDPTEKDEPRDTYAVYKSDGFVELKPYRCGGPVDTNASGALVDLFTDWCSSAEKAKQTCPGRVFVGCDAGVPMSKVLASLEATHGKYKTIEIASMTECKADEGPVVDPVVQAGEPKPAPIAAAPNAKPPVAEVRVGMISITGPMTEDELTALVKPKLPAIQKCFEAGLVKNQNLMGRISMKFEIGKTGALMRLSEKGSDMPDIETIRCVLRATSTITFPAKGGIIMAYYPLMFMPR